MCSFAAPRALSQTPKEQWAASEFTFRPQRFLQVAKVPFAAESPDRHCCPFRWARLCEANAQHCSGSMTISNKLEACEKLAFHRNSRVATTAAATWGTEHHHNGHTQRPSFAAPPQFDYLPESLPGPRKLKLEKILCSSLSDSLFKPEKQIGEYQLPSGNKIAFENEKSYRTSYGSGIEDGQGMKDRRSSSLPRVTGPDIAKTSDMLTGVSVATTACTRSQFSPRCRSCGCSMKGSSKSRSSSRAALESVEDLSQTPSSRSRRTIASNTPEKSTRSQSLPLEHTASTCVGPEFCRVKGLPYTVGAYKTLVGFPLADSHQLGQ